MRPALLAVLGGSLLAGIGAPAGLLLLEQEPTRTYGGQAAVELRTSEPATAHVRTSPARLADVALPPAPPVEVRFAGLRAPVDAVALDPARQVVVPGDVRRAGWYRPGALPGADAGAAVLVGHVDDRTQGLGVFAGLRELAAGDLIEVVSATGEVLGYDVVSLEQFPKDEAPMERLFATDGPHRLVLISCAGTFSAGSYSDNVVVTAVPRP